MIYAAKILAQGELPLAKAELFLARADAFISTISYVNGNGISVNVNLYLKVKGGTSRRIMPKNMIFGAHYLFETDEPFTIQAGDTIEGDSSSAGVDFVVKGGFIP